MRRTTVSSRTTRARPQRGRVVPPRRNWLWLLGATVLGLLVLAGAGVALISRDQIGPIEGVTTFENLPRDHQEGSITYEQTPPVGGVHNAAWANCGIYDQPVPNQYAVHSLEHGAVWITYQPDLPAEAVEQLRDFVRGRNYTLLSPYPNLPSPVVASAWGVQLKVDYADDPRLAQFISKYVQGPQTPEPGAPCYGGVGRPAQR
jgi:hypothetical protein